MKVCPQCGGTYPVEDGFCPMDGARLHDAADSPRDDGHLADAERLIGKTLDRRYRLDELVGQGGMAFVYRATHTLIGKALAIKVLRPDLVHDADVVRRFLQEARLASAVKHPNVVDISDYGELSDGGAYYVMEYLRGRTLAQRIHDGGAMTPVEAISVALQICHGLEAAHDQNIIHRDLKAENVFLCGDSEKRSSEPRVKLLDFGIARVGPRKMTAAGAVLGTPTYMAPEQARGEEVDRRSDLYALGIILFEMLVGWVPFKSDDITDVLYRQINQEPPRIEAVKPSLHGLKSASDLVADLLAKSADDRPSSAAAVRERLSKSLERDLPDGSHVRMLKSTLAMGSGSVASDETPAPAPAVESGRPIKEAPLGWSKTERPNEGGNSPQPDPGPPSSLVASPAPKRGRGGPRSPNPIEHTPIAPLQKRSRGPQLGVVIAGTSVVAAVATLGVYSAMVGFPTQAAQPPSTAPSSTPVAPAASTARVTPSSQKNPSRALPPTPEPARPARAASAPEAPLATDITVPPKADTKTDTKPEQKTVPPVQADDANKGVDRKPASTRSTVKTGRRRGLKPKEAPKAASNNPAPAEPAPAAAPATKGETVTDPPPAPAPGSQSKPPPAPPPEPAEVMDPSDLKDPFD